MNPSLDIVIVNWNSGKLLSECLRSLPCAMDASFEIHRVVIVDNASTDESLAEIRVAGLPLELVRNMANTGFARASNQGATGSTADYLLFLNPDTRVFSDSLSTPLRFMEDPANASVGVLGVQITDENGTVTRDCARFPTAMSFVSSSLGLSKLSPKIFPDYFMKKWDHRDSRFVDHVMGSFYLVRRKIFESINGFDGDFFVYYEDLDFSYRARLAGWKCCFLSSARIYHKGGGTSESVKAARLSYVVRSRLHYSKKHFSAPSYTFVLAMAMTVEPLVRLLHAAACGQWRQFVEVARGYRMVYQNYFSQNG